MNPLERVPPQNLDAEQATLGSMMIGPDAILAGIELLDSSDFYREAHEHVFTALKSLSERNERNDIITVQEELRKRGKFEECGGTEYLFTLVNKVPTAANIEHYAQIVKEKADRRRVISLCVQTISTAQNDENADPCNTLMQAALSLSTKQEKRLRPASEVTTEVWTRIEGYRSGKPKRGVPYGIYSLDALCYGASPGELTLIGGRPSHGKSVLLQMLAVSAGKEGMPCLLRSLEMTADDVIERAVFAESRVDGGEARQGRISDESWDRIAEASGRIHNMPIYSDDMPASITDIIAGTKRAVLRYGIKLLLVDYVQLIRPENTRRNSTRDEELTPILRGLKLLAKECQISVVAASQLNRAAEGRRPTAADLREGGNQEAEADKVILLYNPPQREGLEGPDVRRQALAIVAKHRGGRTGEAVLWFEPTFTRFESCEWAFEEPKTPHTQRRGYQQKRWDLEE